MTIIKQYSTVQSVSYAKIIPMKRRINTLLILFLITQTIRAQQEFQFNNSVFNPFLINPAAGGMTDVIHFELSGRTQWLSYDGRPQTFMATGNSQIRINKRTGKVLSEFNPTEDKLFQGPQITVNKRKHIIGGKVWNDAIGPFTKTSLQANYAYHMPLTKTLNFGVGLGLGLTNFRINQEKVKLHETDDYTITQSIGNSSRQNMADAQAGIVIYGEKLYFGFSTSQLFNNSIVLGNMITANRLKRHYFTMLKYKTTLTAKLSLEPSMILKSVGGSPLSYDLAMRLIAQNRSWVTVQYRKGGSLIFQVGSNLIKNMYLSYSYEYGAGKLRLANNGTHELQLGWYLGKNRNLEEELIEKSKLK